MGCVVSGVTRICLAHGRTLRYIINIKFVWDFGTIIVFWDPLTKKNYINNCVEGKISECLFDTAHKTPSAQVVETLKLQLFTYNSFFTGKIQEDACECLMLLIEIMDKGFGLCPTKDNVNSKVSFSEHLFSFVLEKYTICDICTMKSPAFETTSLLYVTPTDFTSIQELLMQEHKQKLYKTCFMLWKGHLAYRIKANFITP